MELWCHEGSKAFIVKANIYTLRVLAKITSEATFIWVYYQQAAFPSTPIESEDMKTKHLQMYFFFKKSCLILSGHLKKYKVVSK